MAKGYWIAHVDVTDPDAYKLYANSTGEALRKYDAKFIMRGGRYEVFEGSARGRHVVVEFKDYETALACYHSPEYQSAAAHRKGKVSIDIMVIEGYDGSQP
jgi:uncharacterized protein (DUF1330 family)